MTELTLFPDIQAPRARRLSKELVCAFGEPHMGPHPLCEAYCAEGERQFWADVAAGIYDTEGYTPADRRAQQRRLAAKS